MSEATEPPRWVCSSASPSPSRIIASLYADVAGGDSRAASANLRGLRPGTRIRDRRQDRLDLGAEVLEGGREDERLAEPSGVFVDGESRAQGRDLEEDAVRLPEVDRAEPEAIDDRRRMQPRRDDALVPGEVFVHRGRPRDVVDRPAAPEPALGRGCRSE